MCVCVCVCLCLCLCVCVCVCVCIDIDIYIYTAGKISIEHVTIFLSKYISKGAVDVNISPDVGNNPSNPYKENETNKFRNYVLCNTMECILKFNLI